jgi:hypothetical protein
MNLSEALSRLKSHDIDVQVKELEDSGIRVFIFTCNRPSPPYALEIKAFATLALLPGEDQITLSEREALRRRLGHLTTDIFGDDEAGLLNLDKEDISDLLASTPPLSEEIQ